MDTALYEPLRPIARGDHSLCKALSALIVLTPHFYCPNLRFTDCNLALTLHQFAANNLLTNQRVDEHVAMDRVGTCMLHVSYMSHVSVVVEDDLPLVGRWSLGTV